MTIKRERCGLDLFRKNPPTQNWPLKKNITIKMTNYEVLEDQIDKELSKIKSLTEKLLQKNTSPVETLKRIWRNSDDMHDSPFPKEMQ